VQIHPPEGGVTDVSFILCEAVRSVSNIRLARFRGRVTQTTMSAVEDRLRILMGLDPNLGRPNFDRQIRHLLKNTPSANKR
jgi:hypothetical protein